MHDDLRFCGHDRVAQRVGVEGVADDRLRAGGASDSVLSGERVMPVTSCPASTSDGTRRRPMAPLAPATKTLMAGP